MIRLFTREREAALQAACAFDPVVGSRIWTFYRMYGPEQRILDLWLVVGPTGGPTGAISRMDGRLAVAVGPDAELGELLPFLGALGGEVIESSPALLGEAASWGNPRHLPTLRCSSPPSAKKSLPPGLERQPPLREVYELLQASDPTFRSTWANWYVHCSHLIRHRLGWIWGIRREGRLAATGGIYAMQDHCGILAGVATHPRFRGLGLASRLCHQLTADLSEGGREAYLVCADSSLVRFYHPLGYRPAGEWAELRVTRQENL